MTTVIHIFSTCVTIRVSEFIVSKVYPSKLVVQQAKKIRENDQKENFYRDHDRNKGKENPFKKMMWKGQVSCLIVFLIAAFLSWSDGRVLMADSSSNFVSSTQIESSDARLGAPKAHIVRWYKPLEFSYRVSSYRVSSNRVSYIL